MEVGEMIQGEFIAEREPLRLDIADFSGKIIYNFGECGSRCGFYYAACEDGQHYLVVTHPNPISVGASGFQITADILPAEIPCTGSGQKPPQNEKPTPFPAWGIVIIVTVIGVLIVMFTRRRRRRADIVIDHYHHYDDDY
jgi:hypothetical protein